MPVQLDPRDIFWSGDRHLCSRVVYAWDIHNIGETGSMPIGLLTVLFTESDSQILERTFVVGCYSRRITVAVLACLRFLDLSLG